MNRKLILYAIALSGLAYVPSKGRALLKQLAEEVS